MARTAIHPGEHLAEQLEALGISAAELARRLAVPTNRGKGARVNSRLKREFTLAPFPCSDPASGD